MIDPKEIPSKDYSPSRKVSVEPEFYGVHKFRYRGREKEIQWDVVDNRIIFTPVENLKLLSERERIDLFNEILSLYRLKSVHHQNIYSAATGATTTGDYFIAVNTQRQHEYYKECAEIGVVSAMIQKLGRTNPDAKIETLFLQMGFYTPENGMEDASEQPFCTCGKCTDLLSTIMTSNATLITYPANSGTEQLKIDTDAQSINEVKPGHVWITPFSVLMAFSEIGLSEEQASIGREALHEMNSKDKWQNRFKPKAEVLSKHGELIEHLPLEIKNLVFKSIDSDMQLELSNKSPSELNSFMVDRIAVAYKARPELEGGMHNVQKVRCVVVRMNDGSFRSAVECVGPKDNATPYAEAIMATKTGENFKTITDVWVMEMNPEDVARGILRTSSKDGLERIYKKRSVDDSTTDHQGNEISQNVNINYIPFNSGNLSDEEVTAITHSFALTDLFTSKFAGTKFSPHSAPGAGATRH